MSIIGTITCYIFSIFLSPNVSQRQLFYYFAFDKFPTTSTISGTINSSTYTHCNNGEICYRMSGRAEAILQLSTVGYHDVQMRISMNQANLDTNDFCYLKYSGMNETTPTISNCILTENDPRLSNCHTTLPDNDKYNNNPQLQIILNSTATENDDYCFWDHLRLYGIPYTNNPTTGTFSPTKIPSLSPTQMPSNNPSTNPILSPTQIPTLSPTQIPTLLPTKMPSGSPTNNPTKTSSNNPSTSPYYLTDKPASHPTSYTSFTSTINPIITDVEVSQFTTSWNTLTYIVIAICVVLFAIVMLVILCVIVRKIYIQKRKNQELIKSTMMVNMNGKYQSHVSFASKQIKIIDNIVTGDLSKHEIPNDSDEDELEDVDTNDIDAMVVGEQNEEINTCTHDIDLNEEKEDLRLRIFSEGPKHISSHKLVKVADEYKMVDSLQKRKKQLCVEELLEFNETPKHKHVQQKVVSAQIVFENSNELDIEEMYEHHKKHTVESINTFNGETKDNGDV